MNNEILKRKLALAKSIFLHAQALSRLKDTRSRIMAILELDFVAEILLKCLAAKYDIDYRREKFPGILKQLKKKIPKLPFAEELEVLHQKRNLVQHDASIPSIEDVLRFKNCLESFAVKIVREEFKIEWKEITLSFLISNPELRKLITNAENSFYEGKYEKCISMCEEVLIKATFEVGDIFGKAGLLTGYFGAGEELKNIISEDYPKKYKEKEFYRPIKELSKAILQLGQAVSGMQFLGDYRADFIKFRYLVENVNNLKEGDLKEAAEFTLNFIFSLLLKWQAEGVIGGEVKEDDIH